MSGIEQAIYARLSNWAGLTVLVSERIFPLAAPQSIRAPFVVYQRISGNRIKSLSGPSYVAEPRFQFDAYAATYEAARSIAEQLRLALDGWQDLNATPPVKGSSLITDQEIWEQDIDPKLYRISMDFMITHDEAAS